MKGRIALATAIATLALPALASADTYCVNKLPCPGTPKPGVQEALDAAKLHPGDDEVQVGPSSEPYAGPFTYFEPGTANDVSIVGAGRGQTVLAATGALPALSLGTNSSVGHLSLRVAPGLAGATGLALFGGVADDVEVTGQGVLDSARGIVTSDASAIRSSSVSLNSGIGVVAENKDQDTDLDESEISARVGLLAKDGADLDTYRVKVYADELGARAEAEGSELWLYDVLLTTSGSQATGLQVSSGAESGATYTTISRTSPTPSALPGVLETATILGASSTLELKNSTVDGYATSVRRFVTGGGAGEFKLLLSNYDADSADLDTEAGLALGPGNIDEPPRFVNQFPISILTPRSFALRADSALIDAGTICIPGGLDLAGHPRSVDSNGDGTCHSDMGAYEYQRIQPMAEFSVGPATAGSPVAFDAGPSKDQDPGDESQFAYAWSFGDGQTGSGRGPDHVYSQPGDYSVTLTVTDPMGLQDTVTRTISVATAGGSGGGGTGGTTGGAGGAGPVARPVARDAVAPVISGLRVSPNRLRIGRALARLSARGGPIRFRLSEPAHVTLRFSSARSGKRKGMLQLNGRAGLNTVRFAGRLSRRRTLSPGAYRLTAVAVDAAGNVARPGRTRFTLLPRP
jgi:PKD domain